MIFGQVCGFQFQIILFTIRQHEQIPPSFFSRSLSSLTLVSLIRSVHNAKKEWTQQLTNQIDFGVMMRFVYRHNTGMTTSKFQLASFKSATIYRILNRNKSHDSWKMLEFIRIISCFIEWWFTKRDSESNSNENYKNSEIMHN